MTHLHVDVDDLWIYAAEYGVSESSLTDSVYSDALPRLLELFDEAGARATFFVVGRDLSNPAARGFCRNATARGHDIANHSNTHPVTFHALSSDEKRAEIRRADEEIAAVTGRRPVGFRAPGYYLDGGIVDALAEGGYLYDSSIMPTVLQPLFKLYVRLRSGKAIDKQFGTPRSPLASQQLRRLQASGGESIYELPVSVLPILRLPIHSTFSFQLPRRARRFINRELARRAHGVLLFHAIDAIGEISNEDLRRRVLPLRLELSDRVEAIRDALAEAGDVSRTTRDQLARVAPTSVRRSRVLG
jgi:peptidoglycan/xylan/chitin deacetylase (PgdA/CDA1 family)